MGGGKRRRGRGRAGVILYVHACMNVWGQCFRQWLLAPLRDEAGEEDDGGEVGWDRGRGEGWGDASLCGRITVTAGWKRRPRRRLLEF